MGKLECLRCGATTEASSEKEGRKKLDHSVGLSIGRPCGDNRGTFYFVEDPNQTAPKEFKSSESKHQKSKR